MRTFKIDPLSNLQIHGTALLATVATMHLAAPEAPEFIDLISEVCTLMLFLIHLLPCLSLGTLTIPKWPGMNKELLDRMLQRSVFQLHSTLTT